MKQLAPPDTHHLLAVSGWLDLGSPAEAAVEAARISAAFQEHPDVLEVRWLIAAELKDWDAALTLARRLGELEPDRPSAWINQAFAMRRVANGGIERARTILLGVVDQFPKEAIIPYNLACYAAQTGELSEAWDWLHRAMQAAGDVERIKEMALRDADLIALRERVMAL